MIPIRKMQNTIGNDLFEMLGIIIILKKNFYHNIFFTIGLYKFSNIIFAWLVVV